MNYHELSTPILKERGVWAFPYTRNKDQVRYGLEKNPAELRAMAAAIRGEGYGFAYLPEASVQGGRHKSPLGFIFGGEINGMTCVDDREGFLGFYDLIKRFSHVKGEIFFLPIAMEGGYRFFGADIPIPTLELVRGLVVDSPNPAQITIGRPMTTIRLIQELGEDWKTDGASLNDFLMKTVAANLPTSSRGIYRNVSDIRD